MAYVDLELTHQPSEDQMIWLHNAVFDPDGSEVHMIGPSVE